MMLSNIFGKKKQNEQKEKKLNLNKVNDFSNAGEVTISNDGEKKEKKRKKKSTNRKRKKGMLT
jgi:hypothetical protein